MPGLECSKVRKAMDTRLKSGRGRALEKQKMGQGGGLMNKILLLHKALFRDYNL